MKHWYVLHTEKNREEFIARKLIDQGYHIYCPMVYKDRRIYTSAATIKRPLEALFPTYFFIQMPDTGGDWENIRVMGEFVELIRDRTTRYPLRS